MKEFIKSSCTAFKDGFTQTGCMPQKNNFKIYQTLTDSLSSLAIKISLIFGKKC